MDLIISFIICIIWGVVPFILKYLSAIMPTDIVLLLISFLWFIFSLIYSLFLHDKSLFSSFTLNANAFILIFLIAFLGIFLKNILYLHVIKYSSRLNLAIAIMSLSSIVSLIFAKLMYNVQISPIHTIGIILLSLIVFIMLINKK